MDDVIIKKLVVEVDGEAVLVFVVPSLADGERFAMIEAVLASNPILRLVDNAEVGGIWNGTAFVTP
jgi:hypothetical protein